MVGRGDVIKKGDSWENTLHVYINWKSSYFFNFRQFLSEFV